MPSTAVYAQALKMARGPVLLGMLVSLLLLLFLQCIVFPWMDGKVMGVYFEVPKHSVSKLIFILWFVDFFLSIYRTFFWYQYIFDMDQHENNITFYQLDILGRQSTATMTIDELYQHNLHYDTQKKPLWSKRIGQ